MSYCYSQILPYAAAATAAVAVVSEYDEAGGSILLGNLSYAVTIKSTGTQYGKKGDKL